MNYPPLPPGFELVDVPVPPPGFEIVPSVADDLVKSGAIGLAKGALGLPGIPGDVGAVLSAGAGVAANAIKDRTGYDIAPTLRVAGQALRGAIPMAAAFSGPGSQDIQRAVESFTGEFYKPKTTAGKYVEAAGEFIPGALALPGAGGMASRAVRYGIAPGVASEAAGQATEGSKYEPVARLAAALVAPGVVGRAISPTQASASRQRMADVLRNEGVSMTAGQETGKMPLRWAEAAAADLPFSAGRAAQMNERTAGDFTAAVLRRVGENAREATPEVIDRAFTRIGRQFDDLASRNSLAADRQLGNDLVNIERDYFSLVPPSQRAPIVETTIRELGDAIANNRGALPGDAYQALRSRLDKAARGARADPQLSEALFGLRNAIDDAMGRSISPADRQAWQEARRQYRDMLVVEKAATGAGENAALGNISPSQLRNATVNQNRRGYARGQGDFAELARAGEAILKPLPSSGTAQRQFFMHAPSAMLGGILGSSAGPMGAAGGFVAGPLAQSALARALLSGPVQGYLAGRVPGQRAIAGRGSAASERLLRALVGVEAARPLVLGQ